MAIGWRFLLLSFALDYSLAVAQVADIPNMQDVARDLGVKCDYCHAGQRFGQGQAATAAPDGQPPPKFEIARGMIAMTRDLNAKIVAVTGKAPNATTRVTCMTCHRGVPVPGELSDIIARKTVRENPEAAVAEYRELRERFYGRATYDFSEDTLLSAAEQVTRIKPKNAIPLLELNLEFYPKSVRSYAQIAFAYTRSLDDASAMKALEKALEIEPENGVIQGQLEQLKSYHRNRSAQ